MDEQKELSSEEEAAIVEEAISQTEDSLDSYHFEPPSEKGKGPTCLRCNKSRMIKVTYGMNPKGILPKPNSKVREDWAGQVNIMYCPWCRLKVRSFAGDTTWKPFGRAKMPDPFDQMKGDAKPFFEFVETPPVERVIAPDLAWEKAIGLGVDWRIKDNKPDGGHPDTAA